MWRGQTAPGEIERANVEDHHLAVIGAQGEAVNLGSIRAVGRDDHPCRGLQPGGTTSNRGQTKDQRSCDQE